jgi:formate hydrogenlyase subunit 4
MTAAALVGQALAWLVLAPVLPGIVTRTKSAWAGRRGAPVLQGAFDLVRLVRKTPVYSATTTVVFRGAPYTALGAALAASLVVPFAGEPAVQFTGDFLLFAYAWGLGRVALMLGGLDTGSAFEGMGASREAEFSTLLEPALFLMIGALWLASGESTFASALAFRPHSPAGLLVWGLAIAVLAAVVLVESSRMPVDDPTTHLELTMIHEVMVLDHSGPDLAAIQYAAGIKLATGISLLAALLVPSLAGFGGLAVHGLACVGLAVGLGTLESLTARLRMRAIPSWIAVTTIAAAAAVLAAAWTMP